MAAPITYPPTRDPLDDGEAVSRPWVAWFDQAYRVLFAASQYGATADRPTQGLYPGRQYFDTDLGIPIWNNGSGWIDAAGNSV